MAAAAGNRAPIDINSEPRRKIINAPINLMATSIQRLGPIGSLNMGIANVATINGDISIIALASAKGTNRPPEKIMM